MRVPTFRCMGGKARLRSRLIDLFPIKGHTYCEVFAGTGNMYFISRESLQYDRWVVGDINPFLSALSRFDSNSLPEEVNEKDFAHLKADSKSNLSVVLEPSITFAGKGYKYGFDRSTGNHVGYKRANYKKTIDAAQSLLHGAKIITGGYQNTLLELPTNENRQESFVYLDPPYVGTIANYPNIDHLELVGILNEANFKWAVSGYNNNIYSDGLVFKNRYEFERNSEIKSASHGSRCSVVEFLWTNY